MLAKYRFRYEDFEAFFVNEKGKYQRKDEMLWQYKDFIIGISSNCTHFVMNHYNSSFDKSEYTETDISYTLEQFGSDWYSFILEETEN